MRLLRFSSVTFLALTIFHTAIEVQAAQVTIDRTQRSQTIDGFGFFGAHDVWWGDVKDMVNAAWFDAVINDLGITIWRNEIHPPADPVSEQDADWAKIKPVVQRITDKAKTSGVPLKVILSVWSPPSSMKCAVTKNGVQDGTPHRNGTKQGGGLCPSKRTEFARYLVAALKQYQDVGVNVYALSFQNEPLFVEPYNSCVYTPKEYAFLERRGVITLLTAPGEDARTARGVGRCRGRFRSPRRGRWGSYRGHRRDDRRRGSIACQAPRHSHRRCSASWPDEKAS